jgi:hypothetical protein
MDCYSFKQVNWNIFLRVDKGLLLSSLYDDRQAKCYDLRNVRVSDFQAEPLFTYVDSMFITVY